MTAPLPTDAQLYRTMRTIRRFEERVVELVNANEIAGVTHEYVGPEAVATGICAALREADVITSTHRGHGHVIAKGADIGRMFAELLGRVDGLNRGRGGSMHIADVSLGIYGANGIVAAGTPIAAGAAWAAKQAQSKNVAVCFFGDGGLNQGVLFETMNLASLWSLPLIFVCENNGYALTLSYAESTAGAPVERARSFGIESTQVDGMDVQAVLDAATVAVDRARNESRPTFIECLTYRFVGHHTAERTMGFSYRSDEEVAAWRERDPVERGAQALPQNEREAIDAEIESALDAAVAFARASAEPSVEEAIGLAYADGLRPRDRVAQREGSWS